MIAQLARSTILKRSYATATTATAATPIATPVRVKKGSNLKGGFVGFLLGVTITGFGSYYYLIDEYKSSSNAVVSDVVSLQKSIRNLESHVRTLEDAAKK